MWTGVSISGQRKRRSVDRLAAVEWEGDTHPGNVGSRKERAPRDVESGTLHVARG